MKKKSIVSLILILTITSSVAACGNKEKTTILTNDVKQETAIQENKIKKYIVDGSKLLNEEKYDEAKSCFEKAISLDKVNKGAYIEIKNKYIEKQRMDDAYYIIKLAISNNVDVENMKALLTDIKSKFEIAKVDATIYQNSEYSLPTKIKTKINNENKEVTVSWNNTSVDTKKIGTIKYEGKIEEYDRSAELNLKVIKVEKLKKIGVISKVYEDNGKRYLGFDDVEFFLDKNSNDTTAEKEAIKDGVTPPEGGFLDSYYIRNKDKSIVTYQVSPDVEIYVCGVNTMDKQKVSYEKLKTVRAHLFYIYLENNVVVKIEQQYTP